MNRQTALFLVNSQIRSLKYCLQTEVPWKLQVATLGVGYLHRAGVKGSAVEGIDGWQVIVFFFLFNLC